MTSSTPSPISDQAAGERKIHWQQPVSPTEQDAQRYRWILTHPEHVEFGAFFDRTSLGPNTTVSDAFDKMRGAVSTAPTTEGAPVAATYKADLDCPYIHAVADVKSAWADGWNQCAQLANGRPALKCNENAYAAPASPAASVLTDAARDDWRAELCRSHSHP